MVLLKKILKKNLNLVLIIIIPLIFSPIPAIINDKVN